MIPRITKGRAAYGSLAYDHGPGRHNEHRNPHKVAGNVAGRGWRERARAMDHYAREARDDVRRPVHRTSLRLAPGDRRISDTEWRRVAERYVEEMGFTRCPWEATRHADDHIHLTVSRVQWDGELAKDNHDYARAQRACRLIEAEHGLDNASERYNRGAPQVSHGERLHAERRGVPPEREQLRLRIRAAEEQSDGTRESYEASLRRQGVRHEVNIASTGRISGYRYGLIEHRDVHGQDVWFKGSQLGKDYAWTRSQERLDAIQQRVADRGTTKARARPDSKGAGTVTEMTLQPRTDLTLSDGDPATNVESRERALDRVTRARDAAQRADRDRQGEQEL